MNPRERAVFDTLLPSGDPTLKLGLLDAGFEEWLADYRRTATLDLRFGLRVALFAAIWVAPLLVWRLPPISLHGRSVRERALQAMAGSRSYVLRQLVLVLKATAGFCYGANAAVRDNALFPLQHDDPRTSSSGIGPRASEDRP